ncbi:MAG TPA: hypothetical protein VNZ52_05615 [Candidatus Thermoplasmatota archaeon]|nr:hypothetical protein [Candidatus Thermoplasmatota archaeon]
MRALAHTLAVLVAATLLTVPPAAAAEGDAPTEVQVGLLVINFGNYDANRGTYTIDFYLWFVWNATAAPEGFTPEKFEFMNGRATARDRLFDETNATTGMRELWYRIQANLYSEPQFSDYPYDTQTIEILFEDSVNEAGALRYVPLRERSGLDERFRVAGWQVGDVEIGTLNHTYTFEETYDRYRFAVSLSREATSTTLKAFLPPFAFMAVSALSFLFHPSKVAQRLTLGTSMLISAVMFHISQIVSLPPLSQLILFDKIMLSVYSFLAGSLVVTTLIAIDEDWWKDRDHTREINRYGAIATLLLPLVVYLLVAVL